MHLHVYTNHCDYYVSRATYFRHLKRATEHEDENDSSSTPTKQTWTLNLGERDEGDASNSEGDKLPMRD